MLESVLETMKRAYYRTQWRVYIRTQEILQGVEVDRRKEYVKVVLSPVALLFSSLTCFSFCNGCCAAITCWVKLLHCQS